MRRAHGEGTVSVYGYIIHSVKNRNKLEHRIIAERVLNRPLRKSEHVHHVDGNKMNNANENLVICPNAAYHSLLHLRQKAFEVCGNADYLPCAFCRKYDDRANMIRHTPRREIWCHKQCKSDYFKKWWSSRRDAAFQQEPPSKRTCPHGNRLSECNACDVAADFAYDSAREDRMFGR